MLYNKSQLAFLWSAERLFAQSRHVYFWTLTFIHVPSSDEAAMEDYACLMRRIQDEFVGIKGLRVAELHRSHGIHFHLLINIRIPVERMKKLARGTGYITGRNRYLDFGRISVTRCNIGSAEYMAKYLTKDYAQKNSFGGRRRWGTIGGFKHVRKNDIYVENDCTRNRARLFGSMKVGYTMMILIQHYSNLWGAVENWPEECKALVYKQKSASGEWMRHLERDNENISVERFYKVQPGSAEAESHAAFEVESSADCRRSGGGQNSDVGAEVWDGETGDEESCSDSVGEWPF